MARRVQDNFDCIAAWCHPRISASYLRVVFNGWVTDRRMRTLLAKSGQHRTGCVLGCQAVDSLEHYARCKVFWSFAPAARPRGLGLTDKGLGNYSQFFGISQSMSKDDIIQICIGTYALHQVSNILRKRERVPDLNARRLLLLFSRRGAKGSKVWSLLAR